MIATSQNQIVPIPLSSLRRQYDRIFAGRTIARVRSELHLTINKEQPQDRQHRVHPHEANQREPSIARDHARRDTAGGAHQSVDQPGLPPQFGSHPSGGVGDIWQGHAQHQHPQHPTGVIQFSAPQQQRSQNHHGDENGPEPHHHVIAVVKQRNLVRPFCLRKVGQAFDVRAPLPISQQAQHHGNFQGVVEFSFFHIRLSEDRQRRSLLRFKKSFHRRQRRLLIVRNQLSLHVAGGKELQDRRNRSYQYARSQKSAAVHFIALGQQIKSADP